MHETAAIAPPRPLPELAGASREVLEAVLDSRAVPSEEEAARIASLTGLALRQAVYLAEDALATFDDLLLRMHDAGFQLADALETVDGDVISTDQGWNEVFGDLLALPPERGELCAVALVKYRRYLRRRLVMLQQRGRALETTAGDEPAAPPTGVADTGAHDAGAGAASVTDAQSVPGSPGRLDEGGQERSGGAPPTRPRAEIVRLRGGRETRLLCGGRKVLEIWMGTRRFRVLLADVPRLIAPGGEWWVMHNGTILVGRAPECDIVVSRVYDTVSRRHLQFRVEHGALVSVTDLSSGGTYVRANVLPHGSRAA